MGARRIDSRVIKLHRSYSVGEAAEALGVHKNTIANWLRQGLQPIDKVRQILIHGEELRRFLKERRHQRKSPCRPDELWCLRCKAPRRPDGGLVDYLPMSTSGGNLRGLCPDCGCLIHRRVSMKQLAAMAAQFDVAFPQAQSKAKREKRVPSLEQVLHVLRHMPHASDIQRRNRALIAFTLVTGARDSAIASFRLRHVNLEEGKVFQDARDVKTKFSKTFTTWFFPVGDEPLAIVRDWVLYLTKDRLFGPADPVFPRTQMGHGLDLKFEVSGLSREHWASASPIRQIFKEAFLAAGLPYFNPHSFRDTLALLAEQRCSTPEEFKAWSQNLGHEKVMTTFSSYGMVPGARQADIMRRLALPKASEAAVIEKMRQLLR